MTNAASAVALVILAALMVGCPALRPPDPPDTKGKALRVVRSPLAAGYFEEPEYGAYSYILIPRTAESDPRYVALLEAYTALPPAPSGESIPAKTQRLNITYVPVREHPEGHPDAAWLVKNYDASRAATICEAQELHGVGPYIVTAKAPISVESNRVPLSVLDLSDAPRESMRPWLGLFVKRSQEPPDWSRERAEYLALKLHDSLGNLYDGVRVTLEAIEPAGKILKVLSPP